MIGTSAGAFGRLLALWATACAVAVADPCIPHEDLPRAEVRRVIDGDTLVLADGERVRMIGLDAPELGRRGAPDEPLARASREHLVTLVELGGGHILVRVGDEPRDRYGRLLALVYTARHGDLAAHLIRNGLALFAVVPPNLAALDCHERAERVARHDGAGLWGLEPGPVVRARELDRTGFAVVRGTGGEWIRRRADSLLELDETLVLRFRDEDVARWFADHDLEALAGRTITVRGWVHPWSGGRRAITVQHPAAIGNDI